MTQHSLKRVLIVEDDRSIADLVKFHLTRQDFAVASTPDGEDAILLVEEFKPDLVILDWMLEGTSGLEVCRRLRRKPETKELPILFLTARADELDRVRGLDMGADDYVTKPFSPKELVARVNALLRRATPKIMAGSLEYGGIHMDTVAHRVQRDGRTIPLGPTEYRLLRHFLQNEERVFSRRHLLDAVWPHNDDIDLRTVDVHIRRLRAALGDPNLIRTVRSEGYSLDKDGAV